MFCSRRLKSALRAIASLEEEVASMKQDMEDMKAHHEEELSRVRRDISDIVRFIEELSHPSWTPRDDGDDGKQAAPVAAPVMVPEEIAAIRSGVERILAWTTEVEKELKSVKDKVVESKKDLRSHINYSVSRLKA